MLMEIGSVSTVCSAHRMPISSVLHLVFRDPSVPEPIVSAPELSTSLAQIWQPWHPADPQMGDVAEADLRKREGRVRDLALTQLETLWDELATLGLATGEVVDYGVFPSSLTGYRSRVLTLVE